VAFCSMRLFGMRLLPASALVRAGALEMMVLVVL
jgi:hypothetical protein